MEVSLPAYSNSQLVDMVRGKPWRRDEWRRDPSPPSTLVSLSSRYALDYQAPCLTRIGPFEKSNRHTWCSLPSVMIEDAGIKVSLILSVTDEIKALRALLSSSLPPRDPGRTQNRDFVPLVCPCTATFLFLLPTPMLFELGHFVRSRHARQISFFPFFPNS